MASTQPWSRMLLKSGAAFRLHQRVLRVGFRRVDVAVGRHDVVVAGQHDRQPGRVKLARHGPRGAPSMPACSRISGPAADCRSARRGRRSARRSPPPRCSGFACRPDRPAAPCASRSARGRAPGWRRRSTISGRARPRRIRRFSIAPCGKSESAAFSSCRQTTSGRAAFSQIRRLASRLLMLLMLNVAIFMGQETSRPLLARGEQPRR